MKKAEKWTVKAVTVLLLFLLLSVSALDLLGLFEMPDLSPEKITGTSQTTVLFDGEGNVSAVLDAGEMRTSISYDEMPEPLIKALLATEDIRFFEHNGVDVKRILGAAWNDLRSGNLSQGASTITQQLIKNSHLTSEKTMGRKVQEAILALQLEKRYSKEDILEMYLNYVNFGRGAYGVQAAAQAYFGINASELSVPQAAALIGVLKAPSKYAPHLHPENAVRRRNTVLAQMARYGFLSQEEKAAAQATELAIVEEAEKPDFGYYTDMVLEEASDRLSVPVSELLGGGYRIYTPLNASLQEKCMDRFSQEECFPQGTEDAPVQGAACVTRAGDGAILACVGGREHEGMRVLNRALCRRQPGSAIKPLLVYGPALEEGLITCATSLEDSRKSFDGYTPSNFRDAYYGSVTARFALAHSLNVPAVELLSRLGIEKGKAYAAALGIPFDEDDRYLALALGGMKYGTTAVELSGAYAALAAGGVYAEPYCIERITDAQGNVLYEHRAKSTRVLRESTACLLTDMLCTAAEVGSNAVGKLPFDAACKTGTVGYAGTDGYSDAWTAAYTTECAVAVWMGYDRTTETQNLPAGTTGSTYPAAMAAGILSFLAQDGAPADFSVPETVVEVALDGFALEKDGTETLATDYTPRGKTVREMYARGTEPQTASAYWSAPLPPANAEAELDEVRRAVIFLTAAEENTVYMVYREGAENPVGQVQGKKGEELRITDEVYVNGDSYFVIPVSTTAYAGGKPLRGVRTEIVLH